MPDKFVMSKHAIERASSRSISIEAITTFLESPLFVSIEEGLSVYHGIIHENGKPFLIRIFVNDQIEPNLIVTVYKTSKISKYYEGKI